MLPEIDRRYIATGRVSLVFRHLPLPNHPNAARAAWNAECAGQQGQFWQMHDAIFAKPRLDEESLQTLPDVVTVDSEKFSNCLEDEVVRVKVQASAVEAGELGVRSTPTVFLGVPIGKSFVQVSEVLQGALPTKEFTARLDGILGNRPKQWWFFPF